MCLAPRHYINRDALANTVKWLSESDSDHWNMGIYLTDKTAVGWISNPEVNVCNTAGCIAGHIVMGSLGGGLKGVLKGEHFVGVIHKAVAYLGCDYELARALFEPVSMGLYAITREAALAVVQHMLDHQVLDWPRVLSGLPYHNGWSYKNGADHQWFLTFDKE